MTAPEWDRQPEPRSGVPHALTGIHKRMHCAATPDASEHDEDETELDRIAIDNLWDTLAEVAVAIARRREQLDR